MIVYGTRGSDLARTQTRLVAEAVRARTGEPFEIVVFETRGDRVKNTPLPEIGGKGLFTSELEAALHDGRIDAAVHSLKDLPVEPTPGTCIAAVPQRADPHDVLVCDPAVLEARAAPLPLRPGSRIGTSSPRRQGVVLANGLVPADVRGNVPTRVEKVRRGEYAGVLLAAAGLDRLGLDLGELRRVPLPFDVAVPAPAQGALGVQCRADDARVRALLATIDDPAARTCTTLERQLLLGLGGGCSLPIGALATGTAEHLTLRVQLFGPSGRSLLVVVEGDDPDRLLAEVRSRLGPLVGRPLLGTHVLVFRSARDGGELAAGLEVAGAEVQAVALTEATEIHPEPGLLERATRECEVIAFTSPRAVERWFEELGATPPAGARVVAGGPATAAALRARGVECEVPEHGSGGAAVAAHLLAGEPVQRVLFPCARDRHADLEEHLARAGVEVVPVPLYAVTHRTDLILPDDERAVQVFTSPSAVRAYAELAGTPLPDGGRRFALGPTTARALTEAGLACTGIAAAPTAAALTTCIRAHDDAVTT